MSPISLPKPGLRHRRPTCATWRAASPWTSPSRATPSVAGWLRRHSGEIDVVLVGSIGPTLSVPRDLGRAPRGGHPQHRVGAAGQRPRRPTATPRRRLRRRVMGAGTAAFERRVLRASDRVYVCSADEEAMLRAAGIDHVVVVPNGVDLEGIRPGPEPPDGDVVLFPGDLALPARTSIARTLDRRRDRPALRRRAERCRLVVAGRDASPELRAAPRCRGGRGAVPGGRHGRDARRGVGRPGAAAEAAAARG